MQARSFPLYAAALLAALAANVHAAPAGEPPRAAVEFNSCAKPAWPQEDLKARHTGTVTLSFTVDDSGTVKDSSIVKSSGHPGLDEAARSGIAKCHFRNGPGNVQLQYVWTLE
jgi:TonB family protein